MKFLNPLKRLPVNPKTPERFLYRLTLFINASSVPYLSDLRNGRR